MTEFEVKMNTYMLETKVLDMFKQDKIYHGIVSEMLRIAWSPVVYLTNNSSEADIGIKLRKSNDKL